MAKNKKKHMSSSSTLPYVLDHFTKPKFKPYVTREEVVQVYPVNSVVNAAVIDFTLPAGGPNVYLNLAKTVLYLECEHLNNGVTNTLTVETQQYGPVSALLYAMIQRVQLSFGTLIVENCTNFDMYSYINTLFTKTAVEIEDQYTSAMFALDKHAVDLQSIQRRTVYAKNKFILSGPFVASFFNSKQWLPSTDSLSISITLNQPAYFFERCLATLAADPPFAQSVIITGARLLITREHVSEHFAHQHQLLSRGHGFKYSFTHGYIRNFAVANHSNDHTQFNLVSGVLPSRIIVGLVPSQNINGGAAFSPFNFHELNNLSNAILEVNGSRSLVPELINPDAQCVFLYNQFKNIAGEEMAINLAKYQKNYSFMIFDLGHEARMGELQGVCNLILNFKVALTASYTGVALLQYENSSLTVAANGERVKSYIV